MGELLRTICIQNDFGRGWNFMYNTDFQLDSAQDIPAFIVRDSFGKNFFKINLSSKDDLVTEIGDL